MRPRWTGVFGDPIHSCPHDVPTVSPRGSGETARSSAWFVSSSELHRRKSRADRPRSPDRPAPHRLGMRLRREPGARRCSRRGRRARRAAGAVPAIPVVSRSVSIRDGTNGRAGTAGLARRSSSIGARRRHGACLPRLSMILCIAQNAQHAQRTRRAIDAQLTVIPASAAIGSTGDR